MQIDFMIECNEEKAKNIFKPVDFSPQFVDSNANLLNQLLCVVLRKSMRDATKLKLNGSQINFVSSQLLMGIL